MKETSNQNLKYPKATLPINTDGNLKLDPKTANEFGKKFSKQYRFAEPFPHIVIDNFLPNELIYKILDLFPSKKLSSDIYFENKYAGLHKKQVLPENCDQKTRNIFYFFNSSPLLQFLEGLTGIKSLIGDPYFEGGGFHEIFKGGKLGVHADFRINEQLNLQRRINILIYLNKNWKTEYGGNLELWDKKMKSKVQSIEPLFNRCVIFNTNPDSYHGHPESLNVPSDVSRKSIALYYYTASKKIYEDNVAHSTMYVARPNDSSKTKIEALKLRFQNYLKDFLPPIVFRALYKVVNLIKK